MGGGGWICIPSVKHCCGCVNNKIGVFILIPFFVPLAGYFVINAAVPYCPELYKADDKIIIFILLIISGVLGLLFVILGLLSWFAVCFEKPVITNIFVILILLYTAANAAYWIYAVIKMSSSYSKCANDPDLEIPLIKSKGQEGLFHVYIIMAVASVAFLLLWWHFACVINSVADVPSSDEGCAPLECKSCCNPKVKC